MAKCALFAVLFLFGLGPAKAMGPLDVYERALRNDPVFLGAIKERDAGLERRNIARAALLPRLNYTYNKGRNHSKATAPSNLGEQDTDLRRYDSYGSALVFEQPLLDYEAYANYRKGVAHSLLAKETFRSKSQELLVRVLTYYTQALFAQDQIDIAQAKKKAYEQQFQQNEQLFLYGEGTRTDILEAESLYELATVEEIAARDELDASLRELGALIGLPGVDVGDLNALGEGFPVFILQPASYGSWHELAVTHNPDLASLRQALDVASHDIERSRAGHLPKFNAFASSRRQESDSGGTSNQRSRSNSYGIEVSMPLYAGGGVSASIRQASRKREQAEAELEAKTRETLIQLRRQFNACLSGAIRLGAYQKALASAEALVVSTRQSILGGERVNLDALNAEQQLYTTRRNLAKSRYDYLMAWIKLHYYAGILSEADLARVDKIFSISTAKK